MKSSRKVISLNISVGSYQHFLQSVLASARQRLSSSVCFTNVHMVMEAAQSPEFAQVVNAADWVLPDGMPVAGALNLLYGIQQERMAGMDAVGDLLRLAEQESIPVYFYGSTDAVLAKVAARCRRELPQLSIVGLYSPPFRPLSTEEEETVVQQINASGAGFVFVALGCPKQERWMASMKSRIQAVMLGIGGALPVYAGEVSRAPEWMQRASLEWLYRLMQEPRRLFKRYMVTNVMFISRLAGELVEVRLKKQPKPTWEHNPS